MRAGHARNTSSERVNVTSERPLTVLSMTRAVASRPWSSVLTISTGNKLRRRSCFAIRSKDPHVESKHSTIYGVSHVRAWTGEINIGRLTIRKLLGFSTRLNERLARLIMISPMTGCSSCCDVELRIGTIMMSAATGRYPRQGMVTRS